MTLIKSISGIRGTIGGRPGDNLTPVDATRFAAAFGTWLKSANSDKRLKVVVGRDARISGEMISGIVVRTLVGLGIDVLDLGLSTTPTVEFAVPEAAADAGIILTASHNPKHWNALKLLNAEGEFISAEAGQKLLEIVESEAFDFAEVDDLGEVTLDDKMMEKHLSSILRLPTVDVDAIREAGLKAVVDGINSTGAVYVPALLEKLGVDYAVINEEVNGDFAHNPEPLKEHLGDLSAKVVEEGAHLGIVVDPDVDRLAFMMEDGDMFGEEYTLVAVADHVLSATPGHCVSNMSSTRALADVAEKHGCTYSSSPVGEVNVVLEMKAKNAVIGGEGNGGVIYPDAHYGRDALVGIALFLTHLANRKCTMTELKASYPQYQMSKNKVELESGMDVDGILKAVAEKYTNDDVDTRDGVKISFEKEWVHLRKSNTEPIIRVYAESGSEEAATALAGSVMEVIKSIAVA